MYIYEASVWRFFFSRLIYLQNLKLVQIVDQNVQELKLQSRMKELFRCYCQVRWQVIQN